ncbi:ATP-binding cassette domain-containing protein [Rhodobacteraceae bacterium 2CG4]|uniref:ATP-binding cassette domain-containing protein n=2 Tax=Halovulum marinum TaxID=2662447 RepID=A0A6L5Z147_9RHOB|nr:ATP-binding cassette domain-containing protein [Halovulum marinum]
MMDLDLQEKRFGDVAVLGPIRFSLERGETLAIEGRSGIGKTTLLRIIAGLDRTFAGRVSRADRPAIVFQEPTLLPWRTALQNITLVTGASPARAGAALAEVGLAGLEDRFPAQLSLGQQRRLAIARAFSAEPDLLLLDEPFVSLDPALAEDMLRLTERLLRDHPVAAILVTHSTDEARRLATRRAVLEGRPARLRPLTG